MAEEQEQQQEVLSADDYISGLGAQYDEALKEGEEEEQEVQTDETGKQKKEEEQPNTEESKAAAEHSEGESSASQESVSFDLSKLTEEQKLSVFRALTKSEASLEDAQRYAEVLNLVDTSKAMREKYPLILEKLKKSQDVMSYFEDETAYKVSQLAKTEDYKGKTAAVDRLLRSDLTTMDSMKVVELYSQLKAPEGVKNAFRYQIKKIGLDPDEVITNYDELPEDDKDLFEGFAYEARKELSKIGSDIQVPSSLPEDVEKMLSDELASQRDDLVNRKTELSPIATSFVGEIKEIPLLDNLSFKLDLTEAEKKDYGDFVADAVLSGEFDLKTDEGKQALLSAVQDEIRLDKWKEILQFHDSHLRQELDAFYRKKYNNETNLEKPVEEPKQTRNQGLSLNDFLEQMIAERQ